MAAPPQDVEAQIEQALQLGERFRYELAALEEQRAYLAQLITDYSRGRETLEALKTAKDGDEALVPIGGGTFVRARLSTPGKVVSAIGAGVHAETAVADAMAKVEERIENLQKTNERLTGEAQKISDDMARVNALLQELSGPQQG